MCPFLPKITLTPSRASWREGGTRRASLRRPGVDYYVLLGLGGRRWAASPVELTDSERGCADSLGSEVLGSVV